MSSLTISGFFGVAGGKTVPVVRNGQKSKTINFIQYDTTIQCSTTSDGIPATVRVYASHTLPIFPDNTVVYLNACAFISPGKQVLLDALEFTPFPGDPSDDNYEECIPDSPFPRVIGLGNVVGSITNAEDGSRLFNVAIKEFVRDESRSMTIQCAYDAGNRRWINTPVPPARSGVQFHGICHSIDTVSNLLRVNLDKIVLGVSLNTSESSNTLSSPSPQTLVKKRKFNARPSDSIASSPVDSYTALLPQQLLSPTDNVDSVSPSVIGSLPLISIAEREPLPFLPPVVPGNSQVTINTKKRVAKGPKTPKTPKKGKVISESDVVVSFV